MIEFKIRAYGRMELAQLYSPELTGIAAYRKMNKWIVRCPGLQERLSDLGYQPQHRSYTPLEVRAIVDALGDEFTRTQLTEQATAMGIKPNTALSWLRRLVKKGLFVMKEKGTYVRARVCVC